MFRPETDFAVYCTVTCKIGFANLRRIKILSTDHHPLLALTVAKLIFSPHFLASRANLCLKIQAFRKCHRAYYLLLGFAMTSPSITMTSPQLLYRVHNYYTESSLNSMRPVCSGGRVTIVYLCILCPKKQHTAPKLFPDPFPQCRR